MDTKRPVGSRSRSRLGRLTPLTPLTPLTLLALLAALVVPVGLPAAGAAGPPLVFGPTDDATVKIMSPTSNFGTNQILEVDAGAQTEEALLRFDVAGVGPETVQRATLRLFALDSSNDGGAFSIVTDVNWSEDTVTWDNAPPGDGGALGSLASVAAGFWYEVDVTALVTGDGPVSVRVGSASVNGVDFASKEHSSGQAPELVVELAETPGTLPVFDITRDGSTYDAVDQTSSSSYRGTVKFVVESALDEMRSAGGGTVIFGAGNFDLGTDHLEITDVSDVTFMGQGMGVTTIRNDTDAAADTEPFDTYRSDRLTIRDLTVSAGGSDRSTSDALDFDGGDDNLIERVEVAESRGRGIVFDGKDAVASTGGTADRNVVRDCIITNASEDGIQLLGSNANTIENCQISNVGEEGIRVHRSSNNAAQPNKPSNDNLIRNNVIQNATGNGIGVAGGSRNVMTANVLTDNGRAGIKIDTPTTALTCDDNVVQFNEAHGNRYGLNIADPACHRTVVQANDLSGNTTADLIDEGTDTIFLNGSMPVLQPGLVSVVEADSGLQEVLVPVTLSEPSESVVTVDWATMDHQAVAPDDFVAASGQVTFLPGHTDEWVSVMVQGDITPESDEVGLVTFSNPVGATLGGWFGLGAFDITDNDVEPVAIPGVVTVVEGDSGSQEVQVPVLLSGPTGNTVTLDWTTLDFTATAPDDYVAASGQLVFNPGQTEQVVSVTVMGDITPEPDELGFLVFSNPTGATIGGFVGLGGFSVRDDDSIT